MFKVSNKYILIALVGIALGLIVWPFAIMHTMTTFNWWQILAFYGVAILPALIGLLILVNVWGTFEITKEATKEH